MHHLTTLNLPTPSSKEADRQWLAAMLAHASGVQVVESPVVARPVLSKQWTSNDQTIITESRRQEQAAKALRKAGGRPIGAVVDDSPALVERARAMAGLGLSKYAASRALEIGTVRLERMGKQHGFQFATKAPKAA